MDMAEPNEDYVNRSFWRVTARRLKVAAYGATLMTKPYVINDAGVRIHLDPFDPRAQSIHRLGGCHDRPAVAAWTQLVAEFKPTLIVDVGANYGEVGLATPPGAATLHMFEPNPRVVRRLRRTARELENVVVHDCAASDSLDTATLFLGRNRYGIRWSGMASLDRPHGRGLRVQTAPVDLHVSATSKDRLLFKVDVEGHELAVLRGMEGLLASAGTWLGFCEVSEPKQFEGLNMRIEPITTRDFLLAPQA